MEGLIDINYLEYLEP